jgi:hypothetical protein
MSTALTHLENLYTLRQITSAIAETNDLSTPEEATLKEIEERLNLAHILYYMKAYQNAIKAYMDVLALIKAQLYPLAVGTDGRPDGINADMMDTLVGIVAEWLNVLPVREPFPTLRPRTTPTPSDALSDDEAVGLTSTLFSSRASVDVVTDLLAAKRYAKGGDARSAEFYNARARTREPRLAQRIEAELSKDTTPENPIPVSRSLSVVGRFRPIAALRSVQRIPPSVLGTQRTLGVRVNRRVEKITWNTDTPPSVQQIKGLVFEKRVSATTLPELTLKVEQPSDFVLSLAHLYYYVVPLALAETHHALGDFATAEEWYLKATEYQYLNKTIEASYLWLQLAKLYLDWGDSLFKDDRPEEAFPIYTRVVLGDRTAPADSPLYATPSLKFPADQARSIIENLDFAPLLIQFAKQLAKGGTFAQAAAKPQIARTISSLQKAEKLVKVEELQPKVDLASAYNPQFASVIGDIYGRVTKINGGLDFWGHSATNIPIYTFDYLQSVAINFAQLAINAERDMITYLDRAEQEAFDQQQLEQMVSQAEREEDLAWKQWSAAHLQTLAYVWGAALATQKAANAKTTADDYDTKSDSWIDYEALSTQASGGDNQDYDTLTSVAEQLKDIRFNEAWGKPYKSLVPKEDDNRRVYYEEVWTSDPASNATRSAAYQLLAARKHREYELGVLQRQAAEMTTAAMQAQFELSAAQARESAALAAAQAATARTEDAKELLQSFNNQTFTPDVWAKMGETMLRLYRRYLDMAIDIARMMQRAYNFEYDTDLRTIRSNYAYAIYGVEGKFLSAVAGVLGAAGGDAALTGKSAVRNSLLAAETLMADIQSFTYDTLMTQTTKTQPMKRTISLAERYPFQFESQFRKTGSMDFITAMEDFEDYYPGVYAGRIEAVEIEVDGIIPVRGISGTLTNSGISAYRLPAEKWDDTNKGVKYRVQPVETLVLSDYNTRIDALHVTPDTRRLKIFQGAGLLSTWRLDLPKSINDIDYGALLDVRLTFYFHARFDPDLRDKVKAQIASMPGINMGQRGIPLRWIYPDAFFHFQDTGELPFRLSANSFRYEERDPILTSVGILITTEKGASSGGIAATLRVPEHEAVSAQTAANGGIDSSDVAAWKPLTGGSAIGDYAITVSDADVRAKIVNLAFIFGYSFTRRS